MAKTGKQIQGDIYRLVKDSALYNNVSGEVYRMGYRPRDSRKEDIIVAFTTGLADEVQTGIVTINIYVPDIDPYGNGTLVEDGQRTEELERLAQEWVYSLSADLSCYRFALNQTIYTDEEAETNQHFVVVKLRYRYFGGDYAPINTAQDGFVTVAREENVIVTEDDETIIVQPTTTKQ
jgi:hypothetical protein